MSQASGVTNLMNDGFFTSPSYLQHLFYFYQNPFYSSDHNYDGAASTGEEKGTVCA